MPRKHSQSNKIRKRKGKDLDEILDDAKRGRPSKPVEPDPDLPGEGQFYCTPCARHFADSAALATHVKGKPHKRRLHALKEPEYTQKEANAAGGLGTYEREEFLRKPDVDPTKL